MNYNQYIFKRKIENVFIAPFIGLGKCIQSIFKAKNSYDIYFFFPFYHLGGAEKIHLQIAQLAKGKKAVIVFTRKSNNEGFLQAFKEIGIDIEMAGRYTNNDIYRLPLNLIARGYYAARINRDKAIVFNGQSNFAYKIAPWVRKSNTQFELIHSFNSFSWIRIPFAAYYTKTIMISQIKILEHKAQYKQIHAPLQLFDRIQYIPNAVETILTAPDKTWEQPYKIIYVGRGSAEKRIPAIIAVAKKVKENQLPFTFELIGDVAQFIPSNADEYVHVAGMINDKAVLSAKYQSADFIILLSSTEGMPLVILEAMQNGCIPIVTNVGDLPLAVNNKNGFLIQNNKESIVQETFDTLVRITQTQNAHLESMRTNGIQLIAQEYSITNFNAQYSALLGG